MKLSSSRETYRGCECNEELTPVSVGPCISHADSIGSIVLQMGFEFIFELATPYTLSPCARACGISSLNHETWEWENGGLIEKG